MGKPVTRITDLYTNPIMQGATAPIACLGSTSLFIGGLPVVQMSDTLLPISDNSIPGTTTVMHNSLPLNVMGDLTSQGGSLLLGEFTVLVG